MSFGLGLSGSSCNPSLAWSMGNRGKGRILIKFPMKLDDGWYSEQPCIKFHTFEHRKERKGFKHEFIVLILLDGSVCRIERMGDPDARFDAISPRGSVAHDMAQCFGPEELEQACLDTSDVISTVTLPFDFDLKDVLKICRAIHEGEKTRNYTLQVYNCYFFSLAIQACLTRPVTHWENEVLYRSWLSRVAESVAGLSHALQSQVELHSSSSRLIILRACSTLISSPGYRDLAKVTEEIKDRIQVRFQLAKESRGTYREISNRINDSLWYSAVGSSLHQLIEDTIKAVIGEIIEDSIDGLPIIPNSCTRDLNTTTPKEDPSSSPIDISASGANSPSIGNSLRRCVPESKRLRAKSPQTNFHSIASISLLDFKGNPTRQEERESVLMEWCQWIVMNLPYLFLWLLHNTLGLWGITILTLEISPVPLVAAEDQLERALARLERLKETTRSDLEQFANELHSMMNDEGVIWYRNPWADICNCITQHIEFDIVTESERLGGTIQSYFKGQHEVEDLSISAFQRHIISRIKLQAKEVQIAWLGTAATIEAELEGMLSEVWKMIREDDGFDITKGKQQEFQSGSTNPAATSIIEQQEAQSENAGTEEQKRQQPDSGDQSPNSPADLPPPTNVSIQPISEIDSASKNKIPNINADSSTTGHIRSRASSIVNTNNSPISHSAVETSDKTTASNEQQDTGSGIDLTKPRNSTGDQEPPEDLTSPGDSEHQPSVPVEHSGPLWSRTGIIRPEGTIPKARSTSQGAVRGPFKHMIKSTYVKDFRHQCIALIQIYRHFWATVITHHDDYQSFQRFGIIADHALQAVTDTSNRIWDKRSLQGELDKVMVDLEEYCKTLSGFDDYDPIALIRDARMKDQERHLKMPAVDKLKKVQEIKAGVEFYIHDGGDLVTRMLLNISKKSTSEEVLLKLIRKDSLIKLHENACFYTGPDVTWNNHTVHIKLGSNPSTYRPKKPLPDFKSYFDSVIRCPVHVFVDRNPSIHVLLGNNRWSGLFSLVKLINNERDIILKGTDGTLYNARQVLEQLPGDIQHCEVSRFDEQSNSKARVELKLTAHDYLDLLLQAREYIITEKERYHGHSGWLIEIFSTLGTPPKNVIERAEIRRKIIRELPPDSTSSHPSAANNVENVATRVKAMVEKIEQAEKDAKNRNKDAEKKKGFLDEVFGR